MIPSLKFELDKSAMVANAHHLNRMHEQYCIDSLGLKSKMA